MARPHASEASIHRTIPSAGRPRLWRAIALVCAAACAGSASAQNDPFAIQPRPGTPGQTPRPATPTSPGQPPAGPGGPGAPAAPATPDAPPTIDQLPAQLRSGLRAEALRLKQKTIPVVVIVADAGSYVRAIEAWRPLLRFPVLIDDGSRGAREDIARFVRGFQPERVVRWSPDNPASPDSPAAVQDAADSALRAVWGFGTADVPRLGDAVRAACGQESPGVVVASGSDPAWTAGLALAAGRGQPIVWVSARQDVSGELTKPEGVALCDAVEQQLTSMGVPWAELGDTIDTVALCLNTPASMGTDTAGQRIAVTDRLGHVSDLQTEVKRWGWTSQVHGTEAQAAYRAMCGMFLTIDNAWMFDTYPPGQPWDSYALKFAAQTLGDGTGFDVVLTQTPRNGLAYWRATTATPLTAPLVMVNTKGMRDYFELTDGTAWCGDVPILAKPAAVYFIHSFSAQRPGDRGTLAGRWFERGAFAYLGAVQEPYLQTFVPPVAIAGRFKAGAVWGVTCRGDNAPVWKLALFGDPLLTLGPAQERSTEPLPLDGAVGVDESMRDALRAQRLAEVVRDLSLLGRDDQVFRLVSALRRQDPGSVTPELADAALASLYRVGAADPTRLDEFFAAYRALGEPMASDPLNVDMLWLAGRRGGPSDGSLVSMLRPRVRAEQRTPDTVEMALQAAAHQQRDAAIAILTDYRRTLPESAVTDLRLVDWAVSVIRGR